MYMYRYGEKATQMIGRQIDREVGDRERGGGTIAQHFDSIIGPLRIALRLLFEIISQTTTTRATTAVTTTARTAHGFTCLQTDNDALATGMHEYNGRGLWIIWYSLTRDGSMSIECMILYK